MKLAYVSGSSVGSKGSTRVPAVVELGSDSHETVCGSVRGRKLVAIRSMATSQIKENLDVAMHEKSWKCMVNRHDFT